ncbi:MAG TPA: UdgX family uracil-DNA binding protein [Burkholderiales bacterium]|nr:UdgX family uracil-DNA binding protein [Burkholderiales bacterium]
MNHLHAPRALSAVPRLSRSRTSTARSRSPSGTHPAARASTLQEARNDARGCHACPLWRDATQTVFGEGEARAAVMLVGEQPGDREDRAGRPFVGPAGQLLDRALAQAGIDRENTYVTNAVKHFKFEPRGKRRMHKKPADAEIDACHQWLERELEFVAPRLVVALGATAARALLGRATPIASNRGRVVPLSRDTALLITVHPSALLRIPDSSKAQAYRRFLADLEVARRFLAS